MEGAVRSTSPAYQVSCVATQRYSRNNQAEVWMN
jgi:hypothetical protein